MQMCKCADELKKKRIIKSEIEYSKSKIREIEHSNFEIKKNHGKNY